MNDGATGQVTNEDIYVLVMSCSNLIDNNRLVAENCFNALEKRLEDLEDQITLLVSAIALSPSRRANTVIDSNKSSNTIQVYSH